MDREKSLDLALANIEKQFGKGSLMRLGDEAAVKIASIPTGALSLDLALGIGGLPRGRVVEIYGPESSGKCHPAGTYIWTEHGLETIEEVFARVGQPASCTSRVTDVREHGLRLVNEEDELEPLAAVTHNNRRPVWRVTLGSGRHVEATANHPLRILNEHGRIVWRKVRELQDGDVLVSALFGAEAAVGSSDLSEDEALLLGYLVAEGALGEANRHAIRFTNAHDPDVFEEFVQLVEHVLGVAREQVRTYADKDHAIYDTALRRRLADDYGLAYPGSADKEVPYKVRTGGPKIQRAFLSALFEGDGWIEEGPNICLTSASRTLIEQVQHLLYGLGVPATIRTRHHDELDRDYHQVSIPAAGVPRFLDQIGFRSARRRAQVERIMPTPVDGDLSCPAERLPHLEELLTDLRDAFGGDRELDRLTRDVLRTDLVAEGGRVRCTPRRLIQILEWVDARHTPQSAVPLVAQLRELVARPLTYERIVSIEAVGEVPTFDVMVPETHSFLANGVLSHNTTVALHAVAEAQRAGGIAAFIDAEHALDPSYAKALGVDINELLVSQPDTGEQALEIADMLIRSNAVDIVVIDSVAALTPRAEIEGEMGDSHVGLQARLMSQALRKLSGSISRSRTTAVFINQLREKVGVMFGCASGSTRVTLADGSHETIARIVKERLPVEVLTYDGQSGRIVKRPVTDWFDNGPTERFHHIVVERAGAGTGHGESHIDFTANHRIMTPSGWREARELEVGDRVIQSVPTYLSEFQWEVVLGTLMGDASLSETPKKTAARLRWGHGRTQAEYADWKASLFSNVTVSRTTNAKGAVFHDLKALPELAELRQAVYLARKKVLSWDYLKRLTPLSLAIWYQDDGSFQLRSKGVQERTQGGSGRSEICVSAFEATSRERLRQHLADTWGLDAKLKERGKRGVPYLVFGRHATDRLHELVAPYVHPSMEYKLLPRFRGRFAVTPEIGEQRFMPVPMVIRRIEVRDAPRTDRHRYDIEVAGTHNYFADGIMVHNSPETTPGGRALKFYSSVRLDVRRIETLKDGTDAVGNRVRVKVVKNKCVAAGTKVFDPATGLTHRVEDIVQDDRGAAVWAVDKVGRAHVRPILRRMDQGEQDTIGLELRDGTELVVTPDHRILTEHGWHQAGDLQVGDRVARPRRLGDFGTAEPIPADHARLLGYLIGDGYVGGKTPIAVIDAEPDLQADAAAIAESLGCKVRTHQDGLEAAFSHRPGERNGVTALARWAEIYGHLEWQRRIPAALFQPDVSEEVLANLIFGIWESDGWISRDQTDGVRVGFVTTSEQLAWQLHWLLLRWGITSAVSVQQPGSRRSLIDGRRIESRRPCWQVRVSGIDNVTRFADALPTWGPRGRKLTEVLDDPGLARHRGSRAVYLSQAVTEPVLAHLRNLDLRPVEVAAMIGERAGDPRGGLKQVLGLRRLRRDHVQRLADALDDPFLREMLQDDLYYDRVIAIHERGRRPTFDIEVEEHHNFVADDVVVHNCAPPFRQAEFDIVYGEGISKEGSLIDVGVDEGIIRKAGAWYTYDGEQLGQGKENARNFLKENGDIALEIEKKIKDKLGVNPIAADEVAGEVDDEDEEA